MLPVRRPRLYAVLYEMPGLPAAREARNEPASERGVLFRLSAGVVDSVRSVGVAEIYEVTAFDATYAEQWLAFAVGIDWSSRPYISWFSWKQRCSLHVPSGVEAETGAIDGAAAPDLTDAMDAVAAVDAIAAVDASTFPAAIGVVPSRGAATDAVRSVAETAVPVHGGSARVGLIQSDSPKGGAQERCDLREPPGAVEVLAPTSSPPHIGVVTGTEGSLRPAPMPTPSAPQPSGRYSSERLREEAAFTALQYACYFEGQQFLCRLSRRYCRRASRCTRCSSGRRLSRRSAKAPPRRSVSASSIKRSSGAYTTS